MEKNPEKWTDILLLPETADLNELLGSVHLSEGMRLSYLASLVTPEMGVIVEIGSFKGRSTCFLAAGSRAGHNIPIYAVDTWELRPTYTQSYRQKPFAVFHQPETKADFDRQTAPYQDLIIPIEGYSTEVAKTWDKPIGLLFIDGDHDTDPVLLDYKLWARWIPIGGFIAFHDYTIKSVAVAVNRIIEAGIWGRWNLINTLISARRRK